MAAATDTASTIERCPLCGVEFDSAGKGCRPSCPMASGCRVVCCPGCGYSFPQERAGLAGRLRAFLERHQAKPSDAGRGP